jgi:group I intron endonuclease
MSNHTEKCYLNGETLQDGANPVLSGVYLIFCLANNREYYGSSIDIAARWKVHCRLLKRNCHPNPHLQNIYNKYGLNSLIFSVMEFCSKEDTLSVEQNYLDTFSNTPNCINVKIDACGGEISEEAKIRKSQSLKNYYSQPEKKLIGNKNPFFGKKHSETTKNLISQKNSGKKRTEEYKKERSEWMKARKGKHHSEEHKQKLRVSVSGSNNPSAIEVSYNGKTYGTIKDALKDLGLKYRYQLDKLLNAERLSQ